MSASCFSSVCLELARHIVALGRNDYWIVTAESCTGGLVAGCLTEIPGSSAILNRGFVTYTNEAKIDMLQVDPVLIEQHGAVSEHVAKAMAQGALKTLPSALELTRPVLLAIAITGIAGPGGATPNKPVGLVHFAVATWHRRDNQTHIRHDSCQFGDVGRKKVRELAVEKALMLIKDCIQHDNGLILH